MKYKFIDFLKEMHDQNYAGTADDAPDDFEHWLDNLIQAEVIDFAERTLITASNACAIGNQGKGLETLCWDKLAERHSFGEREVYINKDLQRGIDLEPIAKDLYILETGHDVEEVGFITNKDVSKVGGASPDGLVNEDGLLEIKAPTDVKHFKSIVELRKKKSITIDSEYVWQMNMQMLFTGRKWCDYLQYNPNFKQSMIIQRVEADEEMQEMLLLGLAKGEQFIKEIEILI